MTDPETNESTPLRRDEFAVLDRVIKVSALNAMSDGQILGLMKVFRRYTHGEVNGDLMLKMDHALSKLLDKADNDWLDYQIMEGNVGWVEVLAKIMPCLRTQDTPAVAEKPVKSPRAKKAVPAKKAVAKRAAKRA